MEKKRFLIIQTAFIGDVILMTPMIERLQVLHAHCEIDVVVRKGNSSILEGLPVRNIYLLDRSISKFQALKALRAQLKQQSYDTVYVVQRFWSAGLISLFPKAQKRVGFDKSPFAFMFTRKQSHTLKNNQHEIERNLSLIAPNSPLSRPLIQPENLPASISPIEPFVIIAPASVWFTKQWPVEQWKSLIQRIPWHIAVYGIGSSADSDLIDAIFDGQGKNLYNLCGQLSLRQSATLMQKALQVFTNDSGPLHLASAMNAKHTAIFCSTVPSFGFGPVSEFARIVETSLQLDCRPCGLHGKKACPKGHFDCGNSIQAFDVLPSSMRNAWILESSDVQLNIKEAISRIKRGECVLMETDTVPGLHALASNKEAVNRIFEIKNRPAEKRLIVLVSNLKMFKEFVGKVPEAMFQVLDTAKHATTCIVPVSRSVPEYLYGEEHTIAIRIPQSQRLCAFIDLIGEPIVSTSANVSGEPTPKAFEEVSHAILNAEVFPLLENFSDSNSKGQSSTIIKIQENGEHEVIRP